MSKTTTILRRAAPGVAYFSGAAVLIPSMISLAFTLVAVAALIW